MADLVRFALADGSTVIVTAPARPGVSPVGAGGRLETAEKSLRQALGPVTAAASDIMRDFRALAQQPDEIEIAFGVALDGKLGGVIATVGAGVHFDVKIRWSRPVPAQEPSAD